MNSKTALFVVIAVFTVAAAAFAEGGTVSYQAGDTLYVFPWRACLIASGVVSFAIWYFRNGKS